MGMFDDLIPDKQGPTLKNVIQNAAGANPVPSTSFEDLVPQQPSFADQAKRQLGLTARYLGEGLPALPNLVGDAANSLINIGTGTVNRFAGTHIPALQLPSQATENLINAAGLPKPETTIEKVVAEPSKMIAALPAYALAAPATGIHELAPLAENLKAQLFGATGAGTALGVTKQYTDNPVYQLAASILGGAAGAGASNLSDNIAEAAANRQLIPSTSDLRQTAKTAYESADKSGLIIKPDAINNLRSNIEQQAADFGYHPTNQPRISTLLSELRRITAPATDEAGNVITQAAPVSSLRESGPGVAGGNIIPVGQNVTAKQMQILRQMATTAITDGSQSEKELGRQVRNTIDSFMENISPNDVLQGNSDQAVEGLKKGAEFWKRYRKSQQIENADYTAEMKAAASGSGGNIDNSTRQAINRILLNPKMKAGYTPDEITQMEQIVKGGPITNSLRLIGKLSPTTGALPAMSSAATATAALATGNPWVAALASMPLVGYGAKQWAESRTADATQQLLDLIRSGGTNATLNQAVNPAYLQPDNALSSSGFYPLLLQSLLQGNREAQPALGLLNGGASRANATQPTDTRR